MQFFSMCEQMIPEYRVKDEIVNQGLALQRLAGGNKKLQLALIARFGGEFRQIIKDFKSKFRSVPTPDDLLWIAGVHAGKDPLDIAKELEKKLAA